MTRERMKVVCAFMRVTRDLKRNIEASRWDSAILKQIHQRLALS